MALFNNAGKKPGTQKNAGNENAREMERLNTLIANDRRTISTLCFEMGKAYYQAHCNDASTEFPDSFSQIRALLEEIEAAEASIKRLKGIMVCPDCGTDIPANSVYCPSCGAQVGRVPEAPACCPACGKPVREGSSFCIYCGTKLNG